VATTSTARSPLPSIGYTLQDCRQLLAGPELAALGWDGIPTTASGGFGCSVTTGRGSLDVLRTPVAGLNSEDVARGAPKVLAERCAEVGAKAAEPTTLAPVDWLGSDREACADDGPTQMVAVTPSSKVVLITIAPTVTLAPTEAREVLTAVGAAAQ
jgi:hypothetical protein